MKKKISSFVTAVLIMLVCVFASACGNKYKNMEFKIYYAFSADATESEWVDGTNGISLNYGLEDNFEHLFIKVEVDGVKAKHVDSITISSTSVNGLGFSTTSVNQGDVVDLQILGNVNTSLKFYENNSGRKFETPLVISRKLEAIEVDSTIKPAMTTGLNENLDLLALNNLTYHPLHQTNQLGVKFSIESLGWFNENSEYFSDATTNPDDHFKIVDGKLTVVHGSFVPTAKNYAVKVRATSIYNEGTKEGEDAIFASFYVYLAEPDITAPDVKFPASANSTEAIVLGNDGTMHIYENGESYASSTVNVHIPEVGRNPDTIYQNKIYLHDGTYCNIAPAISVLNAQGVFEKFDPNNTNHQAGINGLIVSKNETDEQFWQYKFSIADRLVKTNRVKIAFDLGELDFSCASKRFGEMEFDVYKGVLPNAITVNDVNDYTSSSVKLPEGVAYATKDETYKGFELKLSTNPSEDSGRKITLSYGKEKVLAIYDDKGYPLNTAYDSATEIFSGQKVFLKFRNTEEAGELSNLKINLITSIAPEFYNGEKVTSLKTLTVPFTLNRVVTADKFEFVTNGENETILLDAGSTCYFNVRVYVSGNNFNPETVTITSNSPAVKFGNFATEVKLNDTSSISLIETNAEKGYRGYRVSVVRIKDSDLSKLDIKNIVSEITIKAGDFAVNVSKRVTARSVWTATKENMEDLSVVKETQNIKTFSDLDNGAANFAIPLRERSEFRFNNSKSLTQAIQSIKFNTETYDGVLTEFNNSAVKFLPISNSAFEATGNIAGKTQVATVIVNYYDMSLALQTKEIQLQIAVFDKITRIDVSFDANKDSIGFINPYFTEISSIIFNYRTFTSSYATPVSNLSFLKNGDSGFEAVRVDEFAKISLDRTRVDSTIFGSDTLEIVENGDLVSGNVEIKLLKNIAQQSVDQLKFAMVVSRLDGLDYEEEVRVDVAVNLKKVQQAKGIYADVPIDSVGDLAFSFMDVVNGGFDSKKLKVELEFGDAEENSIKFDNISKSLTYIIYRYEMDANGHIIYEDEKPKMTKLSNDFFRVEFNDDGTVDVKVYKGRAGGKYCLVLATKDSYNVQNPSNLEIIEQTKLKENFDKKVEITISVSDGTKSAPFKIYSPEDLNKINNNLTSHFVLAKDIDLRNEQFSPIGKDGSLISDFKGSLNGENQIVGNDGEIKLISCSITVTLDGVAESTDNGTLVGLFASVGESATIKNLNLNVQFGQTFSSSYIQGLKIGSIAGVNKGTIENVEINLQGGSLNIPNINTASVNFGGIAGLNSGKIKNCLISASKQLQIVSSGAVEHRFGLIAGTNHENGIISGKYAGKESLNNFIFDVKVDLSVVNACTNSTNLSRYYVGGIAGENKGTISNLLVGGRINFSVAGSQAQQTGAIGGFAGISSLGLINTVTALSLDVISTASNVDAAGIAGSAKGEINNAKFVTADTDFGTFEALGQISGRQKVAGIAGTADGVNISNSSVESFVQSVEDKVNNITKPCPTIIGENTAIVAGLVASGTSTVTNSFVNANLEGGETTILTTDAGETNTYFIGSVGKIENSAYVFVTPSTSIASYSVVISENGAVANGMLDMNDEITWKIQEGYNVQEIDGVATNLPFILYNGEPLMIVAPKSIKASVNADYVTKVKFVHVSEFNIEKYDIREAVLVNFLESAGDEENSHNLFASLDGTIKGLLNSEILPVGAQGGLRYQILGTGYRYAYFDDQNRIVFTGASRETPILLRIYSVFNPELQVYVVFYSHNLFTDLKLSANSLRGADSDSYEINLYTGQSIKQISLDTENVFMDGQGKPVNTTSLFDVYGIGQFLDLMVESDKNTEEKGSQIAVQIANFDDVNISINDGSEFGADYQEILTFKLYLKKEYYNNRIKDYYNITVGEGETEPTALSENVLLTTVKLRVRLYNVATGVLLNGDDVERTTHDDVSFEALLTTNFVNSSALTTQMLTQVSNGMVEVFDNLNVDTDSIKIKFEILEGQDEANKLISRANEQTFADLFEFEITRDLFIDAGAESRPLGYNFDILMKLKNQHEYRFIESNIRFNIVVVATSKEDEVFDSFEITLKPAVLSTATIENYAVKTINVGTDYTNIVSNTHVSVSIIEPGSLGNVMLIYLEPTYSEVKNVSIKTSELYVQSLGRNVKMKFTQLVYDKRMKDINTNTYGAFATLYGGKDYVQQGDTLQLELVSEIDENHNRSYNGIIALYVQLEKFSGMGGTLTAELNVETSNGKIVTRTRNLLTTYLPEVDIKYDNSRAINDGYLIQEDTSNNRATLQVYGYQFNSNPVLSFAWHLSEIANTLTQKYEYVKQNGVVKKLTIKDAQNETISTYNLSDDGQILTVTVEDKATEYLIGDYVQYYLETDYDKIQMNTNTGAYEVPVMINVEKGIPASFCMTAVMTLTTTDGQLKNENQFINFYPVDYLLNSIEVGNLGVAVNEAKDISISFLTDNEIKDVSKEILTRLLKKYDTADKFGKLFSYYRNGEVVDFSTETEHPEFEFKLINGNILSISGNSEFNSMIDFEVDFGYSNLGCGLYSLSFGQVGESKAQSANFRLNIAVDESEIETLIYDANDIFDSETGTWKLETGANYVLMNDIVLENVVPITENIGRFDGNNRIIHIKSFRVNDATSRYGLFAQIGTFVVQDAITLENVTKQTILKNMIVDYSGVDTIALSNNATNEIVFGGLVAVNEGGLIYNCDVLNDSYSDTVVTILVPSNSNVVFGGLVGENSGIITNSRVGRDSYTRIEVGRNYESQIVKSDLRHLKFEIYNKAEEESANNKFSSRVGGFVGTNNGKISTSYLKNTSLLNYSTNETTNKTAGFVAENLGGTINYSYVKADETNLENLGSPYSLGCEIENKGNGIVAGFVFDNGGEIRNSFANTVLTTKSAYISGFVYSNTGTIGECYSACTMNAGNTDSYAEQPFIGMDNKNDLLSEGTIENSFYLMRSTVDTPYYQGDKDVAYGLNELNFQNSEYLIGFSFVLSNNKEEREQGIWSYYSVNGNKRVLPELVNADMVAHSYRYVADKDDNSVVLRNATNFASGSKNNPHTISSVDEFNDVFTSEGDKFSGYVRFINDIDFNDDETAIKTRSKFTLGKTSQTKTSIEGNGMSISGVYLEVDTAIVEEIGLFAKVQNAYIKNLNLNFAVPATDGQFSTITATYSGGLAGKIENSVILNINLNGAGTTLTGRNFVGGLAGMISGKSLIYGISSNLNMKATSASNFLYYNENDYNALNIQHSSNLTYDNYINRLSYAGGLAGVLDLSSRTGVEHNVQYVDIWGEDMSQKTFEGAVEANILAEYAGGVAGYAGPETNSYRVRYFTGKNERIQGDTAVGGLYGVSLGKILASQVTAKEETQFNLDTNIGEYIQKLQQNDESAKLDVSNTETYGNLQLLSSNKYAGGLVGIALNSNIRASYSKAGIMSGEEVGGLVGLSVASTINYSYSIPYINLGKSLKNVGGLVGSAYGVQRISPERNKPIASFEALVKQQGVTTESTDIQFTYSTIILQSDEVENVDIAKTKLDYVCANYRDADGTSYLSSNAGSNLIYVYAGVVKYPTKPNKDLIVLNETKQTSNSAVMELHQLYNTDDPAQTVAFNEVFAGWAVMKYWSLKQVKYFPLLTNEIVDNYIDIDQSNWEIIGSNPEGNYRIVGNINIGEIQSNWVFRETFQGTIIGERPDGKRPIISVRSLKPNDSGNSSGFFREMRNATISNIEIRWGEGSEEGGFDLSNVEHLGMVSGFACLDNGSLITNVQVSGSVQGNDGNILKSGKLNKPIGGFGALVGDATNTSILACGISGKVDAILASETEIFVGGLVGVMRTISDDATNEIIKTSSINNSRVGLKSDIDHGVNSYPTTNFKFTIKDAKTAVYIGGLVGNANKIAIASTNLGELSDTGAYKVVDIDVKFNNFGHYLYCGGLVGKAENGYFTNCFTSLNVNLTGEAGENSKLLVGGLMGDYSIGALTSNTTGIINCSTLANISTFDEDWGELSAVANNSTLVLSTGVAQLSANALIKQCLINGKIDTEKSKIKILYAGGVAGQVNSAKPTRAKIEEVMTTADLTVGTSETKQLYAGGLVGQANRIDISHASSWGKIVPITSNELEKDLFDGVYVGGMIGQISNAGNNSDVQVAVKNSYTISSIISDSIASKAIKSLDIGGLVGQIPEDENLTKAQINFGQNVYYSSDYALAPDENYVLGAPIGINLGAETIAFGSVWHSGLSLDEETVKQDSRWISYDVDNKSIPYVESLENLLLTYEIILKDPITKEYKYKLGSPMRPVQIRNDMTFEKEWTYYILDKKSGVDNSTVRMSGTLNGVLIGRNFDAESTFELGELSTSNVASGIVAEVGLHSAISNLHIKLNKDVQGSFVGIIAGVNNGMIFNCSVQGNNIKSTASRLGLITYQNNGIVSNCYSTAEIVSSKWVAGIVYENNAKMLSNYFTGYLEADNAGAGIFMASSTPKDAYLYNNYMAGVVNADLTNVTAFANINLKNVDMLNGENNYIDRYSDTSYGANTIDHAWEMNGVLKSIETGELMSGKGLAGEWHCSATTSEISVLNVSAQSFGYNYNYPVYRFNKLKANSTEEIKYDDLAHIIQTGDSGYKYSNPVKIDDATESTDQKFASVYNNLVTDETMTGGSASYKNAIKIPHLGVLASINSLPKDEDPSIVRSYVIIYDINGNDLVWDSTKKVGGFNAKTFTGILVSNKYFAHQDPNGEEAQCVVTGLSLGSLLGNVKDGYVANITLGSFSGLKNSGAIGSNLEGDVIFNHINFAPLSKLTGTADSSLGALAGTIASDAIVRVSNFSSIEKDKGSGRECDLTLSEAKSVGLIAGKSQGSIHLEKDEEPSRYAVKFSGGENVGGVVGELAGGIINANGNVINLIDSGDSASVVNMLGGVAGLVTESDETPTIVDVNINIMAGTSEKTIIKSNGFGGIAGKVTGKLVIGVGSEDETTPSSIKVSAGETEMIEFIADADSEESFFGLIVGIVEGDVTVNSFEMDEKQIKAIHVLSSDGTPVSENCGVGALVGGQKSGSLVFNIGKDESGTVSSIDLGEGLLIWSANVHNLGAVMGYYVGGSLDLGIEFKNAITLSGVQNVGGIIGFVNTSLDNISKSEKDLFMSDNQFATIQVCGGKNHGGLFGYWKGSNKLLGSDGEDETKQMVNKNNIVVYHTNPKDLTNPEVEVAENVGGVVGYLEATSDISNMSNIGAFMFSDSLQDFSVGIDSNAIKSGSFNGILTTTVQMVNVGGVIGNLTTHVADVAPVDEGEPEAPEAQPLNVSELSNSANVVGYQNVGGLIGVINTSSKLNITHCGVVCADGVTNLQFHNTNEIMSEQINATVATCSSGEICGVLNVGGAFGAVSGSQITISELATSAKVVGNTNVGGLIGLANEVNLVNNVVQGLEIKTSNEEQETNPDEEEKNIYAVVKGVYYTFVHVVAKEVNGVLTNVEVKDHFLPTSVGGLIGNAIGVNAQSNLVWGIEVTSSAEGAEETSMISTISNFIFNDTGAVVDYQNIAEGSNLVKFEDITTGFGGMLGSTDIKSMDAMAVNYLVTPKVSAQTGVNVGTYYGVLNATESRFVVPVIYGDAGVSGAYNVGGIVGFVNYSAGTNFPIITNSGLSGKANINLQADFDGMFVGGLIGRTRANNVSGLNLTGGNNVQIVIHETGNYYVGGLVGRAEMGYGASGTTVLTFEGDFDYSAGGEAGPTSTGVQIKGSDKENFGGLIGMLKVAHTGSSLTVNVSGNHIKAFTINTVENSNYQDGESRFKEEQDEKGLNFYAEAYYVNLDNIRVIPSRDETLYDKNASNPLYKKGERKGWAKEYTMFRQLQRNIPVSENNGAEWDSISVLYDAANIQHVGTFKNMGLDQDKDGDKKPDYTALQWSDKMKVGDLDGDKVPDLNPELVNEDYVCYTIYGDEFSSPTLYSPIGIAELASVEQIGNITEEDAYYEHAVGKDKMLRTYLTPKTGTTSHDGGALLNYLGALFLGNELPGLYQYITLNDNPGYQGLTYFNWWKGHDNAEDGYLTDSNDYKWAKYQNQAVAGDGFDCKIVKLTYFVKDFMDTKTAGESHNYNDFATHGSDRGAYFIFKVVYENGTLNGHLDDSVKSANCSDEYLPYSGSVFETNGTYTEDIENFIANQDESFDWVNFLLKAGYWTITIVSIALTIFGGPLAGPIKSAVSGVFYKIFSSSELLFKIWSKADKFICWSKKIITNVATRFWGKAIKGGSTLVKRLLIASLILISSHVGSNIIFKEQARQHYFEPKEHNFGYLSNVYSGTLSYYEDEYGNIKLGENVDNTIKFNEEFYMYYSTTRPADYHINKYMGYVIDEERDWSVDLNDDAKFSFAEEAIRQAINDVTTADEDYMDEEINIDVPEEGDDKMALRSFENGDYRSVKIGNKIYYLACDEYGRLFMLFETYHYNNGMYYVHSSACQVQIKQSKAEMIKENASKANSIKFNNTNYVRGSYSDNDGYYYANDYPTNNLYYDMVNKKYYLNDVDITSSATVEVQPEEDYCYNVAYTKDEFDEFSKGHAKDYVLGYGSMQGAYYATTEGGGNSVDFEFVKYAYYKLEANPIGKLGVDYIKDTYILKNQLVKDNNGEYDKNGAKITDPNYNGERYAYKDVSTSKSFQIIEVSDTKKDSWGNPTGASEYRVREIYPATFENPYNPEVYDNLDATSSGLLRDSNYYILAEAVSTGGIKHKPTFFLYDGGYLTMQNPQINNVKTILNESIDDTFKDRYSTNVFMPINTKKFDGERALHFKDPNNNEFESFSFSQMLEAIFVDSKGGWIMKNSEDVTMQAHVIYRITNMTPDDYKEKLGQGSAIPYLYYEGKVYALSSEYFINEGTLSYADYAPIKSEGETMFNNMYLSNPDVGLFTRYRYISNGAIENFVEVGGWGDRTILPTKNEKDSKYSTSLNDDIKTNFIESARVIFGNGLTVRIGGASGLYSSSPTGRITCLK